METIYKGLKIKSKFLGNKEWQSNDRNWNNHIIRVTNIDTKKWCSFEFWASIAEPEIKTENDLLFAFQCFVDDAIASDTSFEDFCDNFGYDIYNENGNHNRKAKSIYNSCCKSKSKLDSIFDGDIYNLCREIYEMAM